jgi:hypothetical protein
MASSQLQRDFESIFVDQNPFWDTCQNPLDRMPEIRAMPIASEEYAYHQHLIDTIKLKMISIFCTHESASTAHS